MRTVNNVDQSRNNTALRVIARYIGKYVGFGTVLDGNISE